MTREKASAKTDEHDSEPCQSSEEGSVYEASDANKGKATRKTINIIKKRPISDKASDTVTSNQRGRKSARLTTAPRGGRNAKNESSRQTEGLNGDILNENVRWFQQRINDTEAHNNELKRQIQEANGDAKKGIQKVKEFQEKLLIEQEENKSAKRKISELEDEVAKWIGEYDDCVAELPRPYYGDPDKVTDDTITAKWARLEYTIFALVSGCLKMTPDQIGQSLSDFVKPNVIEHCKRKPFLADVVIQKVIWDMICLTIFSGEGRLWGGSFGRLFMKMIRQLRTSDPDNIVNLGLISRLKFKIAKDVEELIPQDKDAIKAAANDVINCFSGFVREGKREVFEKYVHKIFKKALKIQSIFIRSKAIFVVHLHPGSEGDRFDPNKMRINITDSWDLENEDLRLDFFVSPGVVKIGTAGGDKFDCSGFVCKGSVVVHAHKESPQEESPQKESPQKESPQEESSDPITEESPQEESSDPITEESPQEESSDPITEDVSEKEDTSFVKIETPK
ncbi:hypothetical protein CP533_2246 [Ophiocordyceps camponoti-saundersi (nom. inval.)]|nr:hypothetical protein CP533_2246 [Ophiocordyceps camponoti-saundersi (nom. inval.)]